MSEKERQAGRKFLTEYFNAHIDRGSKRFHCVQLYDLFPNNRDDFYNPKVQTEESVDISLRESDFLRLLDYIGYHQEQENYEYYNKSLEERLAAERSLRNQHPGVKKAYERYRILLDMVAQGKDIED